MSTCRSFLDDASPAPLIEALTTHSVLAFRGQTLTPTNCWR